MSTPYGQAMLNLGRYQRLVQCDPLGAVGWVHLAFAALWSGNPERTIEFANAGVDRIGNNPRLEEVRIIALVAQGEFEQARKVSALRISNQSMQLILEIRILAASGRRQDAREKIQEWRDRFGPSDSYTVQLNAYVGERDQANAAAALIDSRPVGPTALLALIYYCACGAPFDLEAAPNFAQRLKEGELPWPPPSPINYPDKDW